MPTTPDRNTLRQLKRIAHHLDPVVRLGEHGASDSVVAETRRALDDHELIKVRVHGTDRDARAAITRKLAEACDATVVQRIGRIAVLFRKSAHPDHRLSNLVRFGDDSG
jgi:RNA-binding protein